MSNEEKYDIPISSFLTKSLKSELDMIAKKEERTISFLIRKAVENMIVSHRLYDDGSDTPFENCDGLNKVA